jgi:hypothetical protein
VLTASDDQKAIAMLRNGISDDDGAIKGRFLRKPVGRDDICATIQRVARLSAQPLCS